MPNFKRTVRVVFEGVDIDPIEDLRVAFDVSKSDGEQLNKGTITIWNMRPSSRAALSNARPLNTLLVEPTIKVSLYAGYEDSTKEIITGDVYLSPSVRDGSDWITTIEVYSGITAATLANVNISFDGKTNAKFIAGELGTPLGLDISYTEEASQILENKTYFDFSESGMSVRSLSTFLNRFNLGFTIEEDGKGLVYKLNAPRELDQPRSPENAFNKSNGLVGTPSITRTGVEIVALLRPQIKLLQSFYVESQTINEVLQGNEELTNKYFAKSVRHFGDTHDNQWFTSIEGFYADILDGVYDG